MQKLVQKAVFAALLVSSSAFAEGDLLSKATDGAVTTAKAEATTLSSDEMKDVKGGYYIANLFIPSTVNRFYGSTGTIRNSYSGVGSSYFSTNTRASSSSIYARSFGTWYWGRGR